MTRLFRSSFIRTLALLAVLLIFAARSFAAEPRLSATLSSPSASVGEPVQYELTIEGSFSTDAPVPNVDGIDVTGTSRSSQLSFGGGDVVRRTILTYQLVPQRAGEFLIPPLELEVDGKKLATRALKLTVGAAPAQAAAGAGDLAFAEIRVGKKNLYVGEAVPLEVRLYVDDDAALWELHQAPVLSGSGFTLKRFGKPSQRRVEMAGTNYNLITFYSLITPGRAGRITIGPVPMKTLYSRKQKELRFPQRGDPFDVFRMQRREPARELEVIAPMTEITAEVLPAAGRPANFAGAVGKFRLEGIGTPNRVNVGEPVQMILKVSGDGNFEGVTVPTIAEPDGWRVYDAEENFEATDELGYSGTKTFALPVAPMQPKTTIPVFSFSYFDPEEKKYHTLKTNAAPLTVTGAALPSASASPTIAESQAAPDTPVETPPVAAQDILGILPGRGRAWSPGIAFSTPALSALLFAPVPVIAAILLWRRRSGDQRARRRAELKRDRAHCVSMLREANDPAVFYDAAARVLQIDAALIIEKAPHACELEDILAARKVPAETQAAIEELFDARAALVYAGGGRGQETIRPSDRDRVLETLASYERSEAQ